jgi:hypothetical protein
VPWPYTHLTQLFLVMWTYSLPACLVPTYGFAGKQAPGQTSSSQSVHALNCLRGMLTWHGFRLPLSCVFILHG